VRERLKGIAMDEVSLRRIRGTKDLVEDAVDAAALAIADVQRRITQVPYALLAALPPLAGPVRAIERTHLRIADSVYFSIRLGNRLAGTMADLALDRLVAQAKRKGRS
jgi:hypothetical protein